MSREQRARAPSHLQAVDALRFIAAFAIVVYHFRRFMSDEVAAFLAPAEHFHYAVDLFFVISGFVIAHVYDGRLATTREYATFLSRRVARLAPLHWLTLAFYIVVGVALSGGLATSRHVDNYDWGCLAPNALAIHAFGVCEGLSFNFVSWSVSAEMGMYLLAPLLVALGRRSAAAIVVIAAVATVVLTAAAATPSGLPFLPDRPWTDWTYDFGVLRALPAFCIGVALHFLRTGLARIPHAAWLTGVAALAFLSAALLAPHPALLVALAYVIAVLAIAADSRGRPGRVCAFLAPAGKLTYGIYMLHPLVLTIVLTLIGERLLGLSGVLMDLLVLSAIVLTLGLSVVSLRVFEEPARRWMSGRRSRLDT